VTEAQGNQVIALLQYVQDNELSAIQQHVARTDVLVYGLFFAVLACVFFCILAGLRR
jgi:hypothetical protein